MHTLSQVPEEHLTEELCLYAVQCDGRALEWVPRHLQSPAVCDAAVFNGTWGKFKVNDGLVFESIDGEPKCVGQLEEE